MTHPRMLLTCFIATAGMIGGAQAIHADPPGAAYIFPAGGQRGTDVTVRVGGLNLHETARFLMSAEGVAADPMIERTETLWFEGPLIRQPASQRKEDYPKDYRGEIQIAADARPGLRHWRVANSQGVTSRRQFVVGDLPEVIEEEIDGEPIPVAVTLPVTVNGRIFPREDVDEWTCTLKAGQLVTCEVCAARIGSPLDSRLEVRGPDGSVIAENTDALGTDSRARFRAPADGTYTVRIHDAAFGGLQDYVYRLTITAGPWIDAVYPLGGRRGSQVEFEAVGANLPDAPLTATLPSDERIGFTWHAEIAGRPAGGILLDLDDLPEHRESGPNDTPDSAAAFTVPAVLNGRIESSGDADLWAFEATKGTRVACEVRAARFGSPLDAVLTLTGSDGKMIATADDRGKGQTDAVLTATIPADGRYALQVTDRLASRGGREFAYRVRVTTDADPDFRLALPADGFTLTRGTDLPLKLGVERSGGFKGPITLALRGLPDGVTVEGTEVPANRPNAQLTLKAADTVPVQIARCTLVGTAEIDGRTVERTAVFADGPGTDELTEFPLAVAMASPFRFVADFESKFAPRGSVHTRRYRIERDDYDGPIEVRLADVQARHLQGVTGPAITLPPGTMEFEYPVSLTPWMEVGRTSRSCIMAVATVRDFDGSEHRVCFSSTAQNEQIIVLTDPERFGVRAPNSLAVPPGGSVGVPITVQRDIGLGGPAKVALVLPAHMQGVSAKPLTLPAGEDAGTLRIEFGDDPGPFNTPLTIRVTTPDERGYPVTAEAKFEAVR